ncbi:hypothetical protein ACTFIW_000355 [Dictyostelium discoideum]
MENEIPNKKLKTNLSKYNDNYKIIVLPLIIQKQILYLLYEQFKTDDFIKDYKFKNEIINYFFVNWNWFKYSQILFNHFIPHVYLDNREYNNDFFRSYYNNSIIINNNNNNNNNNKFKIVHNDLIKTIIIDYFEINNKSINYMNSLKSLETVNVRCLYDIEYSFTNSIWVFAYLNKLNNKDLIINIKLDLRYNTNESENLEQMLIDREEFKFKTSLLEFEYDFEYKKTYGFVYGMIKELNPKYLKIKSISTSGFCFELGGSHLQQYHSISKLNQNYESVKIIDDYIPLYALYRFLQSPNLHTLKVGLQFHFLSSIYDDNQINNNNNNNNIGDKTEFDFNKMDNIKFIDFRNFQGDIIDNGVNEDNRTYCSFSYQEDSCMKIPPYSMSLWKQCLQLLSTNSTITNLSFSNNCGGIYNDCGWGERSLKSYNENFLNDFMNSLVNNKTIKTLTLGFSNRDNKVEYELKNINLINKSIASMLDQNTTLESIYIFPFLQFNEISKLTKNTKCKIIVDNKDKCYREISKKFPYANYKDYWEI